MSDDHDDSPIAARVRELEAVLEEKGLLDAGELDQTLEAFARKASPANGFRVVARAWVDEGFKTALLEDANSALPVVGLSMGGGLQVQRLQVVENTEDVHNVLVCTLCSCYPIGLLGPSPTWYKSPAYRSTGGEPSARGAGAVRFHAAGRHRDPGVGRDGRDAVHGVAAQARRHGGPDRGRARDEGDAQRVDRHRTGVRNHHLV